MHFGDTRRRVAIAGGFAAITVLLVTGVLLREDIRWWWRLRGAARVGVIDYTMGQHVVDGLGAVAEARRATRAFLRSLPEEDQPSGIVGYLSEVLFARSGDPGDLVFSVRLNHVVDAEHAVIEYLGAGTRRGLVSHM